MPTPVISSFPPAFERYLPPVEDDDLSLEERAARAEKIGPFRCADELDQLDALVPLCPRVKGVHLVSITGEAVLGKGVEKHGASIEELELGVKGEPSVIFQEPTPSPWRDLLLPLSHLTALRLQSVVLHEDYLRDLGSLSQLNSLGLRHIRVMHGPSSSSLCVQSLGDSDLSSLSMLRNLKHLDLSENPGLTRKVASKITPLEGLQSLNLTRTGFDPYEVAYSLLRKSLFRRHRPLLNLTTLKMSSGNRVIKELAGMRKLMASKRLEYVFLDDMPLPTQRNAADLKACFNQLFKEVYDKDEKKIILDKLDRAIDVMEAKPTLPGHLFGPLFISALRRAAELGRQETERCPLARMTTFNVFCGKQSFERTGSSYHSNLHVFTFPNFASSPPVQQKISAKWDYMIYSATFQNREERRGEVRFQNQWPFCETFKWSTVILPLDALNRIRSPGEECGWVSILGPDDLGKQEGTGELIAKRLIALQECLKEECGKNPPSLRYSLKWNLVAEVDHDKRVVDIRCLS